MSHVFEMCGIMWKNIIWDNFKTYKGHSWLFLGLVSLKISDSDMPFWRPLESYSTITSSWLFWFYVICHLNLLNYKVSW